MPEIPITEARDELAALVNRVVYGGERVRLTRRGRGLAAVVSIEDLELLEMLEDAVDLAAARAALADPGNRDRVPWEEVKRELGL